MGGLLSFRMFKKLIAGTAVVAIAILAVWGVRRYRASQTPQGKLLTAASDVVKAIRAGDPNRFLAMSSTHGVVFGVDLPAIPLAELQREMGKKEGAYCAFFNTYCLRQEDAEGRKRAGAPPATAPVFSYQDRLVTVGSNKITVGISGQFGTAMATVKQQDGTDAVLQFDFILEGGKWKLAGVPYW
jgi:hypothetical protein